MHFSYPDYFIYPDAWKFPVTKGVWIIEDLLYSIVIISSIHVNTQACLVLQWQASGNLFPYPQVLLGPTHIRVVVHLLDLIQCS